MGGSDSFAQIASGPRSPVRMRMQSSSGKHKDLAVADTAFRPGAASFHDGIYSRLDEIFIDCDLKLNLAQQKL